MSLHVESAKDFLHKFIADCGLTAMSWKIQEAEAEPTVVYLTFSLRVYKPHNPGQFVDSLLPISEGIVNSPIVEVQVRKPLVERIEELEKEVFELRKLKKYAMHFDVEMQLRHGPNKES